MVQATDEGVAGWVTQRCVESINRELPGWQTAWTCASGNSIAMIAINKKRVENFDDAVTYAMLGSAGRLAYHLGPLIALSAIVAATVTRYNSSNNPVERELLRRIYDGLVECQEKIEQPADALDEI